MHDEAQRGGNIIALRVEEHGLYGFEVVATKIQRMGRFIGNGGQWRYRH